MPGTGGGGGDGGEGYPSGVSPEQTPVPDTSDAERRPGRLTAAAALAALEGVALLVGGGAMLVVGLTGDSDLSTGVTGGITLVALALLPLIAARGLLLRRSWSRGPAVITQIMALPVAYNLLRADSVAIPAGIALAVIAVSALVLLLNPATTRALDIQGPGRAQEPKA